MDLELDELLLLAREPSAPSVVMLDAARAQSGSVRLLREAAPLVGILALAGSRNRRSVAALLDEGATECLSIDARPADIRAAVYRAADARRWVERRPSGPAEGAAAAALAPLTRREREVLELLGEGNSRATIALTLHIAESTTDTHIKNVYRKLGVRRRAEVRGIDPSSL